MKKLTLFTTGILTMACLGGQAMTAEAAYVKEAQVIRNGNSVVVSYGVNGGYECDSDITEQIKTQIIDQIREQLENKWNNSCLPNIPDTNLPDTGTSDTNTPDTNTPDTNLPDISIPETNKPDNSIPEPGTPDVSIPGSSKPDVNKPESGTPDINTPGTGTPDTNVPDTDIPEENIPGENAPEESKPDTNLSYAEQVVKLVNKEREKRNLAPLSIDKSVQTAAQVRAQEREQSFSHTRPDGSGFATALKEQKVSYRTAGENIAWGQRSPEEVVNAWMNSDGHRANILNSKYTSIGVGYYQNAKGVKYWSQLFIG